MEGVRSVGPLAGLAAATGVTGLVLYRLLRRKRPTHVQVNCWFCNQNTVVPYGNRNCWDCPTCEQYNGFQENGDYNKPIPAQHSEHLNHGVFGGSSFGEVAKPQQWVNCQMLLCKKCNNNQTTKIKQMSSFIPREEDQYDEEIEVYKHHLEQMYKLCRPCQAAVDYYIKHQNRQLRAIMLDYHLKKREADKYQVQSFGVSLPTRAPLKVILLRFLAFLNCAFLLALALWGSGDLISRSHKDSLTTTSTENQHQNLSQNEQDKAGHRLFWEGVLDAVPEQTLENLNMAWRYGWSHQLIVVILGLLACIFAMILAGRIRFTSGNTVSTFGSVVSTGGSGLSSFPSPLLSTPPGLLQLVNQQMYQSQRKSSPSSLPGRLSRALSLGTIPSLSRTDSGYLFSGSRPPSLSSVRKDSPGSDYFSLLSGSCASSPLPSPTPSVAGSAVSSSGSLYHRRPLISPARLNLHGKNLCLSSTLSDGTQTQNSFEDSSHPDSSTCQLDIPHCLTKSKTHKELMTEMRSVSSKTTRQKEDSSSHSSACQVHSTSAFLDHPPYRGISLLHTFLLLSLTVNILFVTIYLYPSLY
ncbi:transmembrane protein 201 isoform X3 [Bombina bombina]|uniref:transmembrane protein 201 isoform X3 n=1 Tax=Bombina bombina TaxID=8345 RepID=UPI00235B28C1|nr:transmembrane protein 201 isoform X3 [Bombina bombina]